MNRKHIIISLSLLALFSCKDEVITPEVEVPQQSENVATMLTQYNANIAALQYVSEGQATVVALTDDGKVTLENNMELTLLSKTETDADIPAFGIDEEGYWRYILNGDTIALTDLTGNAVPALKKAGQGTYTPQVSISEEGYWQMSVNGYQWKKLSDKMAPSLNDKVAESYALFKSTSTADGKLTVEPFIGSAITLELPADDMAEAWRRFIMKTDDNVLLDFSYAGYMHGEVAPPDVSIDFSNPLTDGNGNKYYNGYLTGGAQGSAVYKVFNIVDYGANGNDELSDRDALDKILQNALNCARTFADNDKTYRYYVKGSDNANAIIYFPEGKFILRGGDTNETVTTLRLTMGNIIFKGAGRDKTTIEMAEENEMTTFDKWSAANLIEFKNNNGLSPKTDVAGYAEKGSFSVKVSSTEGIKPGDWICMSLVNNDPALVAEELAPHSASPNWTEIVNNGVQIYDYHQVRSVSSNTLTFYEPIMRKVEAKWGWKIQTYPHYENVGVEDLKILGHARKDFQHHGNNNDDGAFKPIQMIRLTNSWMRRVDFESVSEAHSFVNCANVSAYDIEIFGNRGHSAIRSQCSSRVFIGKVYDHSDGKIATDSGGQNLGGDMEGAGQYHGCGVSKQSMGAVIWNVRWGDDSCFESHATQPRATLIDMCKGGFVAWREGGDINQLPNHLNDLTIWNMTATRVVCDTQWNGKWIWWDDNNQWWKNMPPIIVGWNGEAITFDTSENQIKYYESLNAPVSPNSLYEAQLKNRLGYVPAWLNALK